MPTNPPPRVELGVLFPPSSPWAIAVGGTELAIDGRIPESGSPEGGVLTNEVVWNQIIPGEGVGRWSGGGGLSRVYSVADAPWQQFFGFAGMRHTPDVTALLAGRSIQATDSAPAAPHR